MGGNDKNFRSKKLTRNKIYRYVIFKLSLNINFWSELIRVNILCLYYKVSILYKYGMQLVYIIVAHRKQILTIRAKNRSLFWHSNYNNMLRTFRSYLRTEVLLGLYGLTGCFIIYGFLFFYMISYVCAWLPAGHG